MEEKIYLVPIGQVDTGLLKKLISPLEQRFKRKCLLGKSMPLPPRAYDKERDQYRSTVLLNELKKVMPEDAFRALGVTEVDLFVPQLKFVFGEAEVGGKAAVISLARLKQGFYGLPSNQSLLEERASKEAVHELGHTLGLGHCSRPQCVMFFSNSLADTDRKRDTFCPNCQRKLS